jgi:hypothetical protein
MAHLLLPLMARRRIRAAAPPASHIQFWVTSNPPTVKSVEGATAAPLPFNIAWADGVVVAEVWAAPVASALDCVVVGTKGIFLGAVVASTLVVGDDGAGAGGWTYVCVPNGVLITDGGKLAATADGPVPGAPVYLNTWTNPLPGVVVSATIVAWAAANSAGVYTFWGAV